MRSLLVIAAVSIALYALTIELRWEWDECRKVGHGVMYCVGEVAK